MRYALFLYCFIFPCFLICSVSPLNVIIYASIPAASHVSFLSALINTLVDAGHTVDLIFARVHDAVKGTGKHRARHTVTVAFPDGQSPWSNKAEHLADPFVDTASSAFTNVYDKYVEVVDQLCPYVLNSSEVDELLTSNTYDVALSSGFDFCSLGLFKGYGIAPVAMYSTSPLFYFQVLHGGQPQLPIYENAVLDSRKSVDRSNFLDRTVELLRGAQFYFDHQDNEKTATAQIRARFGPSIPAAAQLARDVAFDFVNSMPYFEEGRPISTRVKYIGGIGIPKVNPVPKELEAILNKSSKGTVIFSFGTQVPPKLITRNIQKQFVDAFKQFPDYEFLWKFDGETDFGAANVHNVKWLPQTDLLYDKRVVAFISHMGQNSYVETSYAGVPTIAIPLFLDQYHNMRQALRLGTGVHVDKTRLSTFRIAEALDAVLNDKGYLERARAVASLLADNPDTPKRVLLETVEFAAKHKELGRHLVLRGAEMSFLAAHGYDVIIALTAAILISSYITVHCLVFLCSKTIRKAKTD